MTANFLIGVWFGLYVVVAMYLLVSWRRGRGQTGGPVSGTSRMRRTLMRPIRGTLSRSAVVVGVALMTIATPVLSTGSRPEMLAGMMTAISGFGVMEWAITIGLSVVALGVVLLRVSGSDSDAAGAGGPVVAPASTRDYLRCVVVATLLGVVAVTTTIIAGPTSSLLLLAYWTSGAGVVAACLMAFLVGRRFTHLPIAPGRVLCIVPVYNEPAESLDRTVRSLLAQTVPVDIVVIDDGSSTTMQPTVHDARLRWWRQANTGKRGAQVSVLRQFDRDTYDFILTVDSDSQPYPDACEHLLRAMSDPAVQAATGMLYISNHRSSLVSLASDIDIGSSCVMMRASRSMLGALETTSGALALYRSELLYDHLDAYAVECGTGDDRWLALRALRRGEVVAVAEARVETDMPETFAGTYRQRLRWARSWWWMLPYVFRNLSFRQMLSPLFGLMQMIISPVMFGVVLATLTGVGIPLGDGGADRVLVLYVVAYLSLRYGLAALYLLGRPGVSRPAKLVLLLAGTPLAILLNIALLTPTRYMALLHLFDNRWQTREVDPNTHTVGAPIGGVAT